MAWFYSLTQGSVELEYILRIALSCLCGGVIGFERTKRQKEAGIRTHIIVALGSALIMVISKYGFFDIVHQTGMNVDASRLAANVVTGISFLGAGMILQRGSTVKGLTTAAGVWATSGVGLAIGAGMYVAGIFATLAIVIIQSLLHSLLINIDNPGNRIAVRLDPAEQTACEFTAWLDAHGVKAHLEEVIRKEDELLLSLLVHDKVYDVVVARISENPAVRSVSR